MKEKDFIAPDTFVVSEKDHEKFPLKKKTAITVLIVIGVLFLAAIAVKIIFKDPFF